MRIAFVVVALVLAVVRPADACQCLPRDQQVAAARVVFAGKLVGVTATKTGAVYEVEVDRVWKGAVARRVTVTAPFDDCLHHAAFARDSRVIFMIRESTLTMAMCDGTSPETSDTITDLDRRLGTPGRP